MDKRGTGNRRAKAGAMVDVLVDDKDDYDDADADADADADDDGDLRGSVMVEICGHHGSLNDWKCGAARRRTISGAEKKRGRSSEKAGEKSR